jgi:hypothetical protein
MTEVLPFLQAIGNIVLPTNFAEDPKKQDAAGPPPKVCVERAERVSRWQLLPSPPDQYQEIAAAADDGQPLIRLQHEKPHESAIA